MSRRDVDHLKSIRYAIAHRYEIPDHDWFGEGANADVASEQLMHKLAALLRLIRPCASSRCTCAGLFKVTVWLTSTISRTPSSY